MKGYKTVMVSTNPDEYLDKCGHHTRSLDNLYWAEGHVTEKNCGCTKMRVTQRQWAFIKETQRRVKKAQRILEKAEIV